MTWRSHLFFKGLFLLSDEREKKYITAGATIAFVYLFGTSYSFGQAVEKIKAGKPLESNGYLCLTTSFYHANGRIATLDPFTYSINAAIDFKLFSFISIPFSLNITSRNKTFNQPSFKHFGCSPSYKWITLHLGYRNLSYSQYTLSGTAFLGGAVDIKPTKCPVTFSFMLGQFRKEISSRGNSYYESPGYERWGIGGKLGFTKLGQNVTLILFNAWDSYNIPIYYDSLHIISPAQNLVAGIVTKNKISKYLKVNLDYSVSILTPDTRIVDHSEVTWRNKIPSILLKTNDYSGFSTALQIGLSFSIQKNSLNMVYKRISPNYKSLGCAFTPGDLESISLGGSTSLIKDMLTVNGEFGIETNNLDGMKTHRTRRIVGSLNGNLRIGSSISVNTNLSNFISDTKPSILQIGDSTRYYQTTKIGVINISYQFRNNNSSPIINCSYSIQEANSLNFYLTERNDNSTYIASGSMNFSYIINPIKTNLSTSLIYNRVNLENNRSLMVGPTLALIRNVISKNITCNISFSYQRNKTNSIKQGVGISRFGFTWRTASKHIFSLCGSFYAAGKTNSIDQYIKPVNETRIAFTYNLSL